MNISPQIVAVLLLPILALGHLPNKIRTPHKPEPGGDPELQVAAITTLTDLELSADQLKEFQELAGRTDRGKVPDREAISDEYRAALKELRHALLHDDEVKLALAQSKVDTLREQGKIEPKIDIQLGELSRKHAAEGIAILTATQLSSYISAQDDDTPDPLQLMLDAAEQVHGKSSTEYGSLKSQVAEQVAELIAGLDRTAQHPIVLKVGAWLDKVRAGKALVTDADRAELEKSARQAVGRPDPFLVIRHWMERDIATLLSNPEVNWALAAELKNAE